MSRARIYLDANVFIDAFENDDMPVTRGRRILDFVRRGGVLGVISELVVAELLTKPLETGDKEMLDAYHGLFNAPGFVEAHPIDRHVLISAARLRAKTKSLKMPDAIHVATAELHDCAGFVTSDRRLVSFLGGKAIPLDASALEAISALS